MAAAERPDHLRVVFGDGEPREAPPITSDVHLEDSVVGNAIYQGDVVTDLKAIVSPEHFESGRARYALEAAYRVHERGQPVDPVSVLHELKAMGRIAQVGLDWMIGLGGGGASTVSLPVLIPSHVLNHARRVRELHVRRTYRDFGRLAVSRAERDGKPIASILADARAEVDALAAQVTAGELTGHVDKVAEKVLADMCDERTRGTGVVPTGFRGLDAPVDGLPIDLAILAGLPGDGKTSLAQAISINVARRGEGVLVNSLETSREELLIRMAAAEARVHSGRAVAGKLAGADLTSFFGALKALRGLPLYLEERILSVRALWERARAVQLALHLRGQRLRLVVVDYLQLMHPRRDRGDDRQNYAEVSKELKGLSGELAVAVLALSQVNEEKVTNRKGQRVLVGDLFGSSQMRKDGRLILGIYNPDVRPNRPAGYQPRGVAEIDILKNTKGANGGTVDLRFEAQCARFDDLTGESPAAQTYTCACGERLEAGRSCPCGKTTTPAAHASGCRCPTCDTEESPLTEGLGL